MNTTILQLFILANAILLGVICTLAVQYARRHFAQKKEPQQPAQKPAEMLSLDPTVKERILHDAETNFQQVLDKSIHSLESDLVNTTAKLRSQIERFGHDAETEETERYHKTINDLHDEAKTILGSAQAAITTHQTELTEKLRVRQAELEEELVGKITELEEELVTRQAELQTELNERQAELEARLAKHHAELRTSFDERQEKVEKELVRHQTELESALKEREASLAKIQTELDTTLLERRNELEKKLADEMEKKRAFLVSQLETKLSDAVSSFLLEAMQHSIDLGAQAPYLTALLEEHKSELISGVTRND
jgi:DNA repair exonuclease SbcCD ATPase subunit